MTDSMTFSWEPLSQSPATNLTGQACESDQRRRVVPEHERSAAWYGHRDARPARYDSSRYHSLNLNSFFFRGTIEFRYFNGTLHAGAVRAYIQFVLTLAAKALRAKTASSKRREFNVATAKYDWRVFLVSHLGLIGEELRTARLHLTKHLAGSAAWKGERRDRRPRNEPQPALKVPATEGSDQHD